MKKLIEFIKFSFIGGIMTILSLFLFWLLNEKLEMYYILSNITSYTVAVILSYFLNSKYAFKQENVTKKEHTVKIIKYFVMRLILLGLDSLCLYLFVDKLKFNVYFTKIILTVFFFLLSYPISKMIIKRKEVIK